MRQNIIGACDFVQFGEGEGMRGRHCTEASFTFVNNRGLLNIAVLIYARVQAASTGIC